MDLLPCVDLLRDHLMAHDRAVQEIIALDHYIEQMGERTFLSTMGEHLTPAFQKMIRISVAEGIKRMYKEYRLQKWLKVQEMSTTVRRVLDAETGATITQPGLGHLGQMVPHMSGQPYFPIPLNMVNHNGPVFWDGRMQGPPQWQPVMSGEFMMPVPPFQHMINLVSPISSTHQPHMITAGPSIQPYLSDELSIRIVENTSTSHQVLENSEVPIQKETESLNQILENSFHNDSVLSDSSDEILDSVNVVNPHNHVAQDSISDMGQTNSALYSDSHLRSANGYVVEPLGQPQNFFHYVPHPGAEHLHPAAMTYQPQQYGWPHQDDLEDPLDDSMEWDSDVSSYDEADEELAEVLFATQQLLPEEQAVRLDVEMGDMGIGHMLFDRVSATWYTSHCEFYRAN